MEKGKTKKGNVKTVAVAGKAKSKYDKAWILEHAVPLVRDYSGTALTLRGLHYKLVAIGMTNDINHYKKVIVAMTDARWDGTLEFDAFVDHERETLGSTAYEETDVDSSVSTAKRQIRAWATSYGKNRWENQPYYVEVFIEKKALQGVFEEKCGEWNVALNPCKGYPSLTFQNDARMRFQRAEGAGKKVVVLYFGDYDCSGEDIPRSIVDTIGRMGTDIELRRVALMEDQVTEWKLPPAPTKETDTRGAKWDGIGQVELDALDALIPGKIEELLEDALNELFDPELYQELLEQQDEERAEFKEILVRDFKSLLD